MVITRDGRTGRRRGIRRCGIRRRGAVAVLLVVSSLLIPAALVSNWVRSTMFDTSGYVDAVAPLAGNATVQSALADAITNALIDGSGLPTRTTRVAGAAIRTSVEQVVATDAFAEVWRATNRVAHEQLRLFVTDRSKFLRNTDGQVAIPVGELLGPVETAIYDGLPSGIRELVGPAPATGAELVLIDLPALGRVQTVIAVADRAGVLLPVAAVVVVLAAVALSARRGATISAVGTLTAACGALVAGGVALVRAVVVARSPDGERDLLGATCDAVTEPLLHEAGLVGVVGLLVALAAVIVRRARSGSAS